jgi:hypothetical protein
MQYLTGYTIKPHRVSGLGEVIFTDGTNTGIRANQVQCEAYGYTYDKASGTCRAFRYNTNLNRNISNINNKFNGPGNTTELGSNTIQINGSNNTTKGFNNNCFISGSNNEIANSVNNATVLGSNGIAIRDGEFVVGSPAGQTSIFTLNGTTTDATSTSLFVNGDTDVTIIARELDTPYFFTIDVFTVRIGGASGSGAIGDRIFLKVEGMVVDTTVTQSTTTIVGFGTTVGWTAACAVASDDLYLKVTGTAAMTIQWQAKAEFTKMIGT